MKNYSRISKPNNAAFFFHFCQALLTYIHPENLVRKSKVYLYSILLASILAAGLFMPVRVVRAANFCVEPNGAGGCYTSIQAAIDAASDGAIIQVASGIYTENITLNKRLQIIGAGSSTVITQTAAGAGDTKIGVVQLAASGTSSFPVLLKNLRIEPVGMAGISVGRFTEKTGTTVSYIDLDHVEVVGTNTSPSTEQERGLYVDLTSTLEYVNITNSAFNNLTYGWYLQKDVSGDSSNVRHIKVTDTTFNHNNHKGIYAEKLSDAVFIRCTADQNGFDSSILPSYFQAWSAGIDINLKAGAYFNIVFGNCTVTDNATDEAKEGGGLTIKARDDGATYGAYPATLSNVSVISGTYSGNERGIRIGEPGKNNASPINVTIENASIYNNTQHYSGADGSAYGDLINELAPGLEVDAVDNWWGDAAGPYDGTGTVEVPVCTGNATSESNSDGVGAGVSDRVGYCPWLSAPPGTPVVVDTVPASGSSLASSPTQLTVEFNQDMLNEASIGAANYIDNYLLVEANGDGFQTIDCAHGLDAGDVLYPINTVLYDDNGGGGPFTAILDINDGVALPAGSYRLYICGTTSIENSHYIKLNNGLNDTTLDFAVQATTATDTDSFLPDTGFRRGEVTMLPVQPAAKDYASTELTLQIPKLDISMPIVGVPQSDGAWDVTWLGSSAGYLDGSAFPTWEGNTVITGHVWDAYDQPGPFSELKTLRYGDRIKIQAWGQTYIYEVRESKLVTTGDTDLAFQSEEYDWVTLLTCERYNPLSGEYLFRRMVRAVLILVE